MKDQKTDMSHAAKLINKEWKAAWQIKIKKGKAEMRQAIINKNKEVLYDLFT
jgi:hypothetical protein